MTYDDDGYEPDDPKNAAYLDRITDPDEPELDERPPMSPLAQHLFGMVNEMNRVYVDGLAEGGSFWKPEDE